MPDRIIRVNPEEYAALRQLRDELTARRGYKVTFNEAVREAIRRHKTLIEETRASELGV